MTYAIEDTSLLLTDYSLGLKTTSKVSQPYVLKIHDLEDSERPREKMLSQTARSLSLHELIAVVLNTGSKSEDVLSLSRRILKEYGPSALTSVHEPQVLVNELQMSEGKACQVVACLEIGRRLFKRNEMGLATIRTPDDVFSHTVDMHSLPKEHLRGLYLDSHHRLIHDEVVAIGTINTNILHPREVFRPAFEYGAVALILVHNHPSGVLEPSSADIAVTKQIIEAGSLLGIHVLDHVIVSKNGYKSITEYIPVQTDESETADTDSLLSIKK
jgi:DNA repair protein RadC